MKIEKLRVSESRQFASRDFRCLLLLKAPAFVEGDFVDDDPV